MLGEGDLGQVVVNRVLLVEDDPETAAVMKSLLESQHYTVILAKDGGQAQSSFVMRKPDMVILDLILPGESGFEICERLKQTDPQVPVLILTAMTLDDARNLATRVGADAYLTKPVRGEQLFAAIRQTAEAVWARFHTDGRREQGEPVRFQCGCGRRFKVSPSHRGKQLTCPSCGEPVMVPRHT